jgi:hypothetical protein
METLKSLRPAEALVLLQGAKVQYRDLLKYTFVDLILRKVLKQDERTHTQSDGQTVTTKWILTGEAYARHEIRLHEEVYLQLWHGNADMQVSLAQVVKAAFEKSRSKYHYCYQFVMKSPKLAGMYNIGFFKRLFKPMSLKPEGERLKARLQSDITTAESRLNQLLQNDKPAAVQFISEIGGNVMLLSGIDLEMLKELESLFIPELYASTDTSGTSGCFMYYSMYSSSFDSESEGYGDSGSGCSSDSSSGCSGCSGCGGGD